MRCSGPPWRALECGLWSGPLIKAVWLLLVVKTKVETGTATQFLPLFSPSLHSEGIPSVGQSSPAPHHCIAPLLQGLLQEQRELLVPWQVGRQRRTLLTVLCRSEAFPTRVCDWTWRHMFWLRGKCRRGSICTFFILRSSTSISGSYYIFHHILTEHIFHLLPCYFIV